MRRKLFASVLAVTMVLSLTACGSKGTDGGGSTQTTGTVKQAGEMHVYSSEALDSTGLPLENVSRLLREGERIYGYGSGLHETGMWRSFVVSFALRDQKAEDVITYWMPMVENGDVQNACLDEEGNLYALLRTYPEEAFFGGMMAEEEMEADADSEEAAAEAETEAESVEEAGDAEAMTEAEAMAGDEMPAEFQQAEPEPLRGEAIELAEAELPEAKAGTAYLLKYDSTGALLYAAALDEKLTKSEYFHVNSMVVSQDAVLMSSNGNVACMNATDGSLKSMVIESGDNGWLFLTKLSDGRVIVNGWSGDGQILQEIDLAAGKPGQSYDPVSNMNPDSITAGAEYDVCWSDSNGIYAMNLGESGGRELMNFIDSDMGTVGLDGYVVLESGQILANVNQNTGSYQTAFGSGYSEGSDGRELTLLTPVSADEIMNREIITLGCLFSDSHIMSEVVKFNKESDTHRIRIINYLSNMTGNDYVKAMEAFNTDIISGNLPDMVVVDTSMPLENYFAKRVFEPLDSYIEQDADLKDAAFMDNILDGMKYQGTSYLVTPGFASITIAAKTTDVKDYAVWNMDAFEQAIEKSGVPYESVFGSNTDAATILQFFVLFNSGNFIDYQEHKCHFDSQEFIRLLQMASKFPTSQNNEGGYEYDDTAWRKGKALFNLSSMGDFDSYWRERYLTFGEDVTFIGFPTESGENGSSFMTDTPMAMSASSKHKDVCWDFMRRLYSEEYQDAIEWSFPVRMSSLEKKAKKATEPEMWLNPETGKMEEQESYWGMGSGESVKKTPLTEEETKLVMDFLKSLTVSASFNEQIAEIIQEDAAPYLKGQKSAEEVAGIIQSRVQVYLNENS